MGFSLKTEEREERLLNVYCVPDFSSTLVYLIHPENCKVSVISWFYSQRNCIVRLAQLIRGRIGIWIWVFWPQNLCSSYDTILPSEVYVKPTGRIKQRVGYWTLGRKFFHVKESWDHDWFVTQLPLGLGEGASIVLVSHTISPLNNQGTQFTAEEI